MRRTKSIWLTVALAVLAMAVPDTAFSRDRDRDRDHGRWRHGDHGRYYRDGYRHRSYPRYYGGYRSYPRYYGGYRSYPRYYGYRSYSGYRPYYYGNRYRPYYYDYGYRPYYRSWWPSFSFTFTRPVTRYYSTTSNYVEDSTVADVQKALARRGYYRGTIDGDIGPMTRAAIRAYQVDRGLSVSGRVDGALLRSLRI